MQTINELNAAKKYQLCVFGPTVNGNENIFGRIILEPHGNTNIDVISFCTTSVQWGVGITKDVDQIVVFISSDKDQDMWDKYWAKLGHMYGNVPINIIAVDKQPNIDLDGDVTFGGLISHLLQ